MRIASFQIENYKSFRVTPEIPLTQRFNVIVGQNNVGKTALVEALSLRFGSQPHRSLRSLPFRNAPISSASVVTTSFQLSRNDLIAYMRRLGDFLVPLDHGVLLMEAPRILTESILDTNTLKAVWVNGTIQSAQLVSLALGAAESRQGYALLRVSESGEFALTDGAIRGASEASRFEAQVCQIVKEERVYAFNAERYRLSRSPTGANAALRPDASNLPEVLANLQGRNPARFESFCEHVKTILPVVQRVSVRPIENNVVEILIWTTDPRTERDDLAVTLGDSGTGIAQVLAILYVVLTADFPQVFLIDEPQSFLHPGAVRKLIEILGQHPQHQFILTTHSPTAVTAAEPDTLLLLRLSEGETIIEQLDVSQTESLRMFLAEIGARLSDVFGADNILWVEGRTEEECFPKILHRRGRPLLGTAIVGVLQTGDFEGRRSKTTVEIYERLSRGGGLLPPAVAFIFDREGRTAAEQEDLLRRSQGIVYFIPRRMYENYLLNPAAIAAVTSDIRGFRDTPVTEHEVQDWLDRNRWDAIYFEVPPAERTAAVWWREIRGARILADMFGDLSEHRVAYDKVKHGAALTEWLLEHRPDDLQEVGEMIERILPPLLAAD